jgi:plastocyanin
VRLIHKSVAVLGTLTFLAVLSLQAQAQQAEVGIRDYKFAPAELKVKAGTTVKWTNNEKRASHSVLFTGPDGYESERLFPGESWQRTFDKPGVYAYTCGPHPEMKGRIEVTE